MKIQITKCSRPGAWYQGRVGEIIEVNGALPDHGLAVTEWENGTPRYILIDDASAVGPSQTCDDHALTAVVMRRLGDSIALLAVCHGDSDPLPGDVAILAREVQKWYALAVALLRFVRRLPASTPAVFPLLRELDVAGSEEPVSVPTASYAEPKAA